MAKQPPSLRKRVERKARRTLSPLKQTIRRELQRRRGEKPVLGIVGFFGHGNYGDELFLSVFEQYFGDEFELRIIPDLKTKPYFSTPVKERVAAVDAIVLGGGDLLQPWNVDARYWNRAYLAKPVFIVGIGVPIRAASKTEFADKPHVIERHRAFLRHKNVRFIGVRDDDSKAWVDQNVKPLVPVRSAPDIVCSLDLPPVEPLGEKTLSIVTRLRKAGEQDDYTELGKLARHVQANGWKVRHLMLGTGVVGERDVKDSVNLEIEGKELIHSEDLDDLSRAIGETTVLASMKFHGSVVATMYGVPSVVLIPTSKNRSFMRRIGRDDLLSKYDDPTLVDRFQPQPDPITPDQVALLRNGADAIMQDLRTALKKQLYMR